MNIQFYSQLKRFITLRAGRILWLLITIYILIFTACCWFKYYTLNYDALDLAIFNQVFFNTSYGRLFVSSIHPLSYLGDHFSPIILLLTPFYSLFRSPITLLFLQTLILGLTAWPIYLLAKRVLNQRWGLFFAVLFLFNPLTHNINLFEFSLLPFAIFFLLWAGYFFEEKKFWPFLIFLLLALTVREDVALVVIMFFLLSLLKRRPWFLRGRLLPHRGLLLRRRLLRSRSWSWTLAPLLLGFGWLFLAFKIVNYFNPGQEYKFLVYYQWLGSGGLSAVIKGFFTQPLDVLAHIFRFGNLEMVLGLLLAFLFLPLFSPRYLLLTFLVFTQYILGASGGGSLILETHYSCLFLPALILASIWGVKKVQQKCFQARQKPIKEQKFWQIILADNALLTLIVVTMLIFNTLALGSLTGVVKELWAYPEKQRLIALKQEFVNKVPEDAGIATTYEFLPYLSNREQLASLHYVYIGHQQFSRQPYSLPANIDYLLIDFSDFLLYPAQFQNSLYYAADYQNATNNFRQIIADFQVVEAKDTLALLKRDSGDQQFFYQTFPVSSYSLTQEPKILAKSLRLNQAEALIVTEGRNQFLDLTFDLQSLQPSLEDYNLELQISGSENNKLFRRLYPLTSGLYPSREWQTTEVVRSHYSWLLPTLKLGEYQIRVLLIKIKGELRLNALRRTELQIFEHQELGEILNRNFFLGQSDID